MQRERAERRGVVDRVDLSWIGLDEPRWRSGDSARQRRDDRLLAFGEPRDRTEPTMEREGERRVSEVSDVSAVVSERRERVVSPRVAVERARARIPEQSVEALLHARDRL